MTKNSNTTGLLLAFKARLVNYKRKAAKGLINGEVGDVLSLILKVVGIEILAVGGPNTRVFGHLARGIVELQLNN